MNNPFCYFPESHSTDWTAIIALGVSIISLVFTAWYGRKTFRLTNEHNKKSVEPLITDLYISDLTTVDGKKPIQAYQLSNCGLGPAIIKSLIFKVNNIEYRDIYDIFKIYFKGRSYVEPSEYITITNNHVIAQNETLYLFKIYFPDVKFANEFYELAKRISLEISCETIYSETRPFRKDKIANI